MRACCSTHLPIYPAADCTLPQLLIRSSSSNSYEQLEESAETSRDDGTVNSHCTDDSGEHECQAPTAALPASVTTTQHTVLHQLLNANQCATLEAATAADPIDHKFFSHPVFEYRTVPSPAIVETNRTFHRPGAARAGGFASPIRFLRDDSV
eukprot:SAG11_NODE_3399_length_2469_cov_4.036287_2_plen_152_part_00